MTDDFDDMSEDEFDAAFDAGNAAVFYEDDEDPANIWAAFQDGNKGVTSNPSRMQVVSFVSSPGITLGGF